MDDEAMAEQRPSEVDEPVINLQNVAELVVEPFQAAPCAVVGAAVFAGDGYRLGEGVAGRHVDGEAADLQAVFDLASLTKPITALTAARLQRRGGVHRDWLLGRLMPELSVNAPAAGAPLDLLMAHRAGLEAHIEFFHKRAGACQPKPADIFAAAAAARRDDCRGALPEEGFPPVYSDLGYILTGEALVRASGQQLDSLMQREVMAPLGLELGSARWWKERCPTFDARVAATEDVPWRGGVLRGIVHDENAWVLAGQGSAGHAGLFGTMRAVLLLGIAILDAFHGRCDDWLRQDELHPLVKRRPGGSHCAGFDRRTPASPSSGIHFGSETFGHLGFTGTSIWIDPDRQLVAVLLCNRVHPTREHIAIRQARPAAHDLLWNAMTGSSEA